ncbi:carboxylating nicotinate-nucleotide diphosphorylase [Reyranella sp. CPCC 100927]|uniref:carboxylating nicotinate-nucleotide diphosphorylase n=1 Tax=Reyranella sp. CPCC 100927 TaxID=2599616 RepID=UPI0011B7E464|nr:carboxylating nicotinate-nucleotide diphosphorylase [Reyranella sp. CPCC 100927]TWT13987.1 carboxylating nicotinate-nucleotide diphosphorylase [Reyranella sp. CPCC 100927]
MSASNPSLVPLPSLLVEPIVRAALTEDLGRAGDITTSSIVPASARVRAVIATRQPGVVAGLECAAIAFRLLDPAITLTIQRPDGSRVAAGDVVASIAGPAGAILTAERVALNFLCHLSGVATATASLVDGAKGHRARITCTRKTTPGLRALEKHAVRAGGGVSHRFGLDDGVLIKDNHIEAVGGIGVAVARARQAIGHMVKIEVEVETLSDLDAALAAGVDAVLLDNMTPAVMTEAVAKIAGRAVSEASGRITRDTVAAVAASGVDIISAGWITHSAAALDLGLDFQKG